MSRTSVLEQRVRPLAATNHSNEPTDFFCARDFAELGLDHGYHEHGGKYLFYPLTNLERQYMLPDDCHELVNAGGRLLFGYSCLFEGRKWACAIGEFEIESEGTGGRARSDAELFASDVRLFAESLGGRVYVDHDENGSSVWVLFPFEKLIRSFETAEQWRDALLLAWGKAAEDRLNGAGEEETG